MQEARKTVEFRGGKPILVMEQWCKNYQVGTVKMQLLRQINLTIKAGEYVAIMRPGGSVKFTLLNMIGCLQRPGRGRYRLGGQDVFLLGDDQLSLIRHARIGFVFQPFDRIEQLSVMENIEVPLYHQGLSEETSAERAGKLATMTTSPKALNGSYAFLMVV